MLWRCLDVFSRINFGRETCNQKKVISKYCYNYKAIISNSAWFACKFKGLALLLYNVTTKAEMTHCSLQLYNKSKNFYVKNQTQNESTGSLPISDFEPAIIVKYAQPILIPATKSINYF